MPWNAESVIASRTKRMFGVRMSMLIPFMPGHHPIMAQPSVSNCGHAHDGSWVMLEAEA